jgi:hypothetical protein
MIMSTAAQAGRVSVVVIMAIWLFPRPLAHDHRRGLTE